MHYNAKMCLWTVGHFGTKKYFDFRANSGAFFCPDLRIFLKIFLFNSHNLQKIEITNYQKNKAMGSFISLY